MHFPVATGKERSQAVHESRQHPVQNYHWHNVNMRVVKPGQDWDEEFRNLGNYYQNQQQKKKDHLRPVTTNTSSKCERSTAGVNCACPSSSRTRKLLTA